MVGIAGWVVLEVGDGGRHHVLTMFTYPDPRAAEVAAEAHRLGVRPVSRRPAIHVARVELEDGRLPLPRG